MGAPKQKWTPEEEAALRAGVEKYGPGKWRAIQKDSKFGPCLTSRSNVDLKDKWRNMSVSSHGHGQSRERSKPHALTAATDLLSLGLEDPASVNPLALTSPDGLADGKSMLLADPNRRSADRKMLGPSFDEYVMEAITASKDRNGANSGTIAAYIEEHHIVPTNFRRLLTAKLKQLTLQGKLVKLRQNYKLNTSESSPPSMNGVKPAKLRPTRGHDNEAELKHSQSQSPRFAREITKKARGNFGVKKAKLNVDLARAKMKTAQEAARAAAQAVAEAEAAASAAEQAAKEAEFAEAEAEAAEAAAEAAQAALRPPKKAKLVYNFQEEATVQA